MVETRGAKRKQEPPEKEGKKGKEVKAVKKVKFVRTATPPSSMAPENATVTVTETSTERETATAAESTERINVLLDAVVGVEGQSAMDDDNEKSSEATLSNEDKEGEETRSDENNGEASSEEENEDGEKEGEKEKEGEEEEEGGEEEGEEEEGESEEEVGPQVGEKEVAEYVEESRDSNVREEREVRRSAEIRNSAESEDGGEETEAIKPSRMFFSPSEYKKKIKLGTRCMILDAIKTLDNLKPKLSNVEKIWFEEHPQFRHIFHMKRENNHKVQGMWMLLLRTAESSKRREVWFIVNGVPIRYGLREHALISGLNCCNYPLDYKERGGTKFVNRHFKEGEPIRLEDVKEKLVNMGPHRDRLKMAVLFFLGSVVCAQTKVGKGAKNVLDFFQRAVDDLDFCKTFPWGRYSYYYMLKEISHTMEHFGGVVKENTLWPLPGFCVPLEVLAFEAIPKLGNLFREPVEGADAKCPRMCKYTFKPNGMKGMSLSLINKELGHETVSFRVIQCYGRTIIV